MCGKMMYNETYTSIYVPPYHNFEVSGGIIIMTTLTRKRSERRKYLQPACLFSKATGWLINLVQSVKSPNFLVGTDVTILFGVWRKCDRHGL